MSLPGVAVNGAQDKWTYRMFYCGTGCRTNPRGTVVVIVNKSVYSNVYAY